MKALAEHNIAPIDLVAVNLYPFRETAARKGVAPEDVIEQIDIGGPSMLRSAAKNFASVTVIVDPADYGARAGGARSGRRRPRSPAAARGEGVRAHRGVRRRDRHTGSRSSARSSFPSVRAARASAVAAVRREPRAGAAFYVERNGAGLAGLEQRGGKELSFNNLLDLEGALLAIEPFGDEVACAIVKHTTPCGLARAPMRSTRTRRRSRAIRSPRSAR